MQCFSYITDNSNDMKIIKPFNSKMFMKLIKKHFNNFDIYFCPFLFYSFEFICMIHNKGRLQNFNL